MEQECTSFSDSTRRPEISFAFIISIFISFTACQPRINYPVFSENNRSINSVVTLQAGENIIHMQDFVLQPAAIDSLTCTSDKLTCTLSDDKLTAVLLAADDFEPFADVKVWLGNVPHSIPCRRNDKKSYIFTFNPLDEKYREVKITGQMNNWDESAAVELQLNDEGFYETTLLLNPGSYVYQLILDGEQTFDPSNPRKVDNGYGGKYSVIQVNGQEQFSPVVCTEEFSSGKITLAVQNEVKNVFIYWQNYLIPDYFYKVLKDKIIFDIPSEAHEIKRSFIRVFVANDFGVSNDILIPLHQGRVLTQKKQLERSDKHSQIIYFTLIDRFNNGNPHNDFPLNMPEVNYKVDFQGGDLAGIKQKIDDGYFKYLGVNTLWVSPVNQNPWTPYGYYEEAGTMFSGYHGYWPISSSQVDKRFGTNNELKVLVDAAHKNNMNVLLDYTANHVHEEHPLYKGHPEFATPLYLPDGSKNIGRWDKYQYTTWPAPYMPALDFSRPEIVELMTDSAMYWLNEFDLDGFRFEACRHVPAAFWRTLTLKTKLTKAHKAVYQIGETYGSSTLINSFLSSGMLDGQFDFNLYDEAVLAFAGQNGHDMGTLWVELQQSLNSYGTHHLMGNISGDHNHARFMAYASRDLFFEEDARLAGWTRDIGVTDTTAYDKLFLLQAFNMTIPGVPVIYYGDEIGLTGGGNPDCRRMMRFNELNAHEQHLMDKVAALANCRAQNPVMIYGDFINIENDEKSWVYARKYFESEAVVFINNSDKNRTFEIELPVPLKSFCTRAVFENEFSINGNKVSIELPPYSAEVLI